MNCLQTELHLAPPTGEDLKKIGIERAIAHAERVENGWKDAALMFIMMYPGNTFMVEEVRRYAYNNGLPKPPHERAWGKVINEAKKKRFVKHLRYAAVSNPKAHKTPASVWGRC